MLRNVKTACDGEEALHTKSFSIVWAYSKWLGNVRAIIVIILYLAGQWEPWRVSELWGSGVVLT